MKYPPSVIIGMMNMMYPTWWYKTWWCPVIFSHFKMSALPPVVVLTSPGRWSPELGTANGSHHSLGLRTIRLLLLLLLLLLFCPILLLLQCPDRKFRCDNDRSFADQGSDGIFRWFHMPPFWPFWSRWQGVFHKSRFMNFPRRFSSGVLCLLFEEVLAIKRKDSLSFLPC